SLVRRLSANFRLSKGQKTPYKALLTGHTGSGKSSELIRVGVELSRDFLVFWFDAERSLVIEKATVFEVILGLGLAVHKAATQSNLQPNPQLAQKLLNSLSKFVRTHEERKGFALKLQPVLKQITAMVIGAGAGATVAGPVGAMIGAIGATTALDLNVRDDLTRTLEMPLNKIEIIGALQTIINEIQLAARLPLLIIIDGLDKVPPAQAHKLFSETRLLSEPDCALLYAAPIDLYFRSNRVVHIFNEHAKLPALIVNKRPPTGDDWRRDRAENPAGIELLRKVAARRLESHGLTVDQIIDDAALNRLARMSGGIMRDMIRLFREAAFNAQLLGKTRIDDEIARNAVAKYQNEHGSQLKENEREVIRRALRQGWFSGGASANDEYDLVYNLHLLSYEEGNNIWIDAHPLVLSSL
ncbi:MAG: hypothetical protein ACREAM_27250, partial [Blastocatellia bacterium]